jgi:C4-dicarboxylate-specific signal transduction histidine kinase
MTDLSGRILSLDDLLITRAMPRRESPIAYLRIAMTRSDGRRLYLSLNTAPLRNASGELTEAVSIFEDITDKVLTEREEALKQQHLVQVDRMISLGILTSGVAHEINNPNTFIMSNAQLFTDAWQEARAILDGYYKENGDFLIGGLQYSKFRDRMPQLCSRILEGSVRIQRIVKELRNYSGKGSAASLASVDVNDVIRSAEILLGNMIRKSTDHFDLHLAADLPTVRADFQRLEQVVINIVQNACQALPDPSLSIHVSPKYDSESGSVILVCSDEGIGIPEGQLGHITDPFFTTKRDKGGTGLGLSISLKIVREYGGTLKFRSNPERGTTVEMQLPAEHRALDRDGAR